LKEELSGFVVVAKFATVQIGGARQVERQVGHYKKERVGQSQNAQYGQAAAQKAQIPARGRGGCNHHGHQPVRDVDGQLMRKDN
jgi:hypothetical protein